MELSQIEKRLKQWKSMHDGFIGAYTTMHKLTGAMPDCELLSPAFDLWDAYTVAVSELVGDYGDWLHWYEFECGLGETPRMVVLTDGREIKVKTLRDLANVIVG